MATDTTLSPYQRFQQVLLPNPEVDRGLYDKVQQDPELREASAKYRQALQEGDPEKIRGVVYNLATQLANREDFAGYGIRPEDVRTDVEKQFATSFDKGPELTKEQQEEQSTDRPGFLRSIMDRKEQSIAGRTGDTTPVLHGLQEEQLVSEFEDAIARGDEDAIARLQGEALELGGDKGLLRKQLDMARAQIGHLTDDQLGLYIHSIEGMDKGRQPTREDFGKNMEDNWERRRVKEDERRKKEKTPAEKEAEEKRGQKERELREQLAQTAESGDTKKRVQIFRQLVRHRIADTIGYSPLSHYYEIEEDGMMLPIQQLMGEQMRQIQEQRASMAAEQQARTMQAQAAAAQGQAQQGSRKKSGGNPLMNFVRNAGKNEIKSLAKQGFKKLLKKGAQELIKKGIMSQPEILVPILIGILIAIIIIIIILMLIGLIVALISIFTGAQSQPATPIPGLTLTLNTNPPGKTNYKNGETINFVIDVEYKGTYSIYVADENPDNATVVPGSVTGKSYLIGNEVAWNLDDNTPLPGSTSSDRRWEFDISFSNVGKDFVFRNTVTASYLPGSGPAENPSQQTTTSVSQIPLASGYCSPANLTPYFGTLAAATVASCICRYESGADPGVVNKSCLKGATADWSVGLFQINLDTNPQRCPGAFSQVGLVCAVANSRTLNSCTASLTNPTTNINSAVAIYHASGSSWDNGWHAEKGKCF